MHARARQHGDSPYRIAVEEVYALREQPEVWLRVAAFVRRALGRMVELRERDGFLDPYMRMGDHEYSLLRDEGHGLRELVILLTAVYRKDWSLLVVDEPELHLHPSMARLWTAELVRECRTGGRHAIVVTHQPELIEPKSYDGLSAVWSFAAGREPRRMTDSILDQQRPRVESSLARNPRLISQLVFSPRPVLVEGPPTSQPSARRRRGPGLRRPRRRPTSSSVADPRRWPSGWRCAQAWGSTCAPWRTWTPCSRPRCNGPWSRAPG